MLAALRSIRSLPPRHHRQALSSYLPQPRVPIAGLSKINLFFLSTPTLATFAPRPNPHSPRPRQRATSRRDFVHWRFSAAGRISV